MRFGPKEGLFYHRDEDGRDGWRRTRGRGQATTLGVTSEDSMEGIHESDGLGKDGEDLDGLSR